MNLVSKDLLGIEELTTEEMLLILDTAATMKQALRSGIRKTSHLHGRSVVTLFYENSTRTRLSFELASKYMGAASANVSASGSSVAKGENLLDTVRTIERMGTDILVLRHPHSGAPHRIAPLVSMSIVNAGDGQHEHPTQALLDLFTIREKKGRLEGLTVAIIGDVAHSRVARSNLIGMTRLGMQVRVAGPSTLVPREIRDLGADARRDVVSAIREADVVMGLRVQLERQSKAFFPSVGEYARFHSISRERLEEAAPGAIVMHPGPSNHGVEMPTSVHDGPDSVIAEQVENGVAVRMAILYLLTTRRNAG